MMRHVSTVRWCLGALLFFGGCAPPWTARFPLGTRLYERTSHRYFGQVVGFDAAHDFSDGASPRQPAILIEQGEGGSRVWGACETCADCLVVEKPAAQP